MTAPHERDLRPGEAHIWYVLPDEVAAPDLTVAYAALLSHDERQILDRRRTASLRHDYLVARALVRTTLSRYAATRPGDWVFRRSEHGRPEIDQPVEARHLRFNLSDTDGLIACAVTARGAVGVDVENTQRRVRPLAVARRFFAASEIEALDTLPAEEQTARFLEYWTLKESYIKAIGLGLSLPLHRIAFEFAANAPITISFDAELGDDPQRWQFGLIRPTPRHLLALSVERFGDADSIVRLFHTVPLESEQEIATSPMVLDVDPRTIGGDGAATVAKR